jgi:hypothetical protein
MNEHYWRLVMKILERKEVSPMQNNYEAPELMLIGEADEVVMGTGVGGDDFPKQFGFDFEFEQD